MNMYIYVYIIIRTNNPCNWKSFYMHMHVYTHFIRAEVKYILHAFALSIVILPKYLSNWLASLCFLLISLEPQNILHK